MRLSRRGLFLASGSAALLAGCGSGADSGLPGPSGPDAGDTPTPGEVRSSGRFTYGDDPSQFAELTTPEGSPSATVVLLHGGYWQAAYGLAQMTPLAHRLTELGYATWNVEYRRVDLDGGYPNTLVDVALAVDRLAGADLPPGTADNVLLVGHSAGGHLAVWAASRSSRTPGGKAAVTPQAAISLAGVLDLTGGGLDPRSAEPIAAFMGGRPTEVPDRYALADPSLLVPAVCPVWALHAEDDAVVAPEQSTVYVAEARQAGATAERLVVPGDHFTVNDPGSASAPILEELLERAAALRSG